MKKIQLVALLCLAACAPKVYNGGYVKDGDIKESVTVGQTRDQVREKLGSPSSQSSFGDETWYYITDRKETTAFFKPELVDKGVVRITFDSAGLVSNVESYDKTAGKDITFVKRETPTEGHTLGFFEQILGNIGRFNKPADGRNTAAPGRKPGG